MNRLPFRMILFTLVLSAVHMAAMAPLADSSLNRLQRQALTTHRPSLPNHGLDGLACTSMGADCLRPATRR